jgi:tetratricopeptide (TPR) repeat protein
MCERTLYLIATAFCLTDTFTCVAGASQAQNSDLRLAEIQQSIISGDLRAAEAELEREIARSPRDARLFNLRGVIEAKTGRFAPAEASFRRAIVLAPAFADAYLNLGRLYQEHPGEPRTLEKALATYQSLLKQVPGHVEANYQAASLLNRQGSYAASLRHLSRLPPESQTRAAALVLRSANYFALGRTDQGEAAARQLLAASDLTELATILEQQGKFQEARAVLEKSPELERPSAAFLTRIAQLAYRAGDAEGALGYLARARDLEPGNARIHFFFGMICVDLKLPPEAKASLQKALRLDPDNAYYNYAFGAVLVGQKNADEAVPHFQKYRDARPEDPRGAFALGVAYFETYQMDRARDLLLSVADKPETRMGAQLYLGRIALSSGSTDDALNHFLKAIKANPRSPDAYADAALGRIRREEYALAEKDLTAALAIHPDHYLSNLRLLMLYQRTRDSRAAGQARRVEELRKTGEEKERLLLRSLEIRPY